MTLSVLIVCLGNICRSPMGEAVLRHEAGKRGIEVEVDSAGTGAYHVGKDPDDRYSLYPVSVIHTNHLMLQDHFNMRKSKHRTPRATTKPRFTCPPAQHTNQSQRTTSKGGRFQQVSVHSCRRRIEPPPLVGKET